MKPFVSLVMNDASSRGPETRAAEPRHKRITRTLRFLVLLAAVGTGHSAAGQDALAWQFWLAAGLLFASNVAYHFERVEIFQKLRLSALLFLFDASVLALMALSAGERSNEFFILFAATILFGATARNLAGVTVGTAAVAAFYTLLTLHGRTGVAFLSEPFLTRLALLFAFAIFVGHLAQEAEGARRAARRSADLYRGLFEMNPALTFLCDGGGRILHVNRAAQVALRTPERDIRGLPLDELATLQPFWRAGAGGGSPRTVESLSIQVLRRDGVGIPCQALVSVVPAGGETLLLIQAHEKPRELSRLRRAVTRAERRVAVGRLAASAVHELNNVLTRILGYGQLLASRNLEAEALQEVREVEKDALVASRIIRNLSVFSQVGDVERRRLGLNATAASVLELKTFEWRRRGIRLEWIPDPELPDVVGDAHALALIILHLADFAQRDIERSGRPDGRIRVRTCRTDDGVVLEVTDDGAPLPPDARHHLFNPQRPRAEGIDGCALYVCRSILRGHGGDLTMSSELGCGTTVRTILPAAGESNETNDGPPTHAFRNGSVPNGSGVAA